MALAVRPARPRSIAAISVILASGLASAQGAAAEALFNDGLKLLAEGQVAKACDAFDASNRADSRAGTLIRLGDCREQNHQLASAWSAFKDALKRVKDPRKRDYASHKVKELEARLSSLTITVADDHKLDGLAITRNGEPFDPLMWNRTLPIDGGDYQIAGRAPGHDAWQATVHVPDEGGKIAVEVPRLEPVAVAPVAPPPVPARPAEITIVPAPPPSRFTARRKLALGVASLGVASGVIGVVLGIGANGKKTDAFRACPEPDQPCADADRANALLDAGHHRALGANIAFGVAGAALLGAGVLWFTGAPHAEHVAVAPAVGNGVASLAVMGSF